MVWALAGLMVLAAPAPKDRRTRAEPPAGDWVIERLEQDGRPVSEGSRFGLRISTDGLHLLSLRVPESPYKLGTTSEPATFFAAAGGGKAEVDLFPDDPKRLKKGIWKVDGDNLTICEADPGQDRPGDFAAPEKSGRTLWVLKRLPKK
jgi:uncharacterized protein (TIGR03067 family)